MNFDEIDSLHVPPQSIEAEQRVLGVVMAYPSTLWQAMDVLEADDFYRGDHRQIWEAIADLADRKRPYDSLAISEWFDSRGLTEQVGGAYLIGLQAHAYSAANVTAYARIVADKALLRKLIDAGTAMVNSGFKPNGRDSDELVAEAQLAMQTLQPKQRGGLQPAKDSLLDWYNDLERRYELGDRLTGMPTPWAELNKSTHGLQKGELILLAARPSMGKSIAGMNLALFAALRGHNTAVFSLEMSRRQIHRRNIASLGNVPHDWLLAPRDSHGEDHWAAMNAALKQIKNAKLHVDDTSDLTIGQVMSRARMLHMQDPIELIVVDHVHDFKIKANEARFEYGKVAQGLKTLAKEFDCPVVALAQLNRNVATRGEKMPTLSDLRESGELEQKGDLILFLHREEYYDASIEPGVVKMKIAKGRDIEAGKTIYLRNDYRHMALRDQPDGFELPTTTVRDRTGWGQ
ncbi:replicative DNA helicase [Lysobacter sp. GCM10012299]|uniref:replicative DNA helicase n=1 Tax=Lysobacter sp. GCM10012299 TaxID=3317333 RepID=UPI0036171B81